MRPCVVCLHRYAKLLSARACASAHLGTGRVGPLANDGELGYPETMEGVIKNINQKALENTYFRQVLENGVHTQVVIMSIPAGGEIGEETHTDNDQVLYLLSGSGKVILNGEEADYETGDIVLVKAGIKHNFKNTGTTDLKIITTYSPPHHPAGTVHKTKEEADAANY